MSGKKPDVESGAYSDDQGEQAKSSHNNGRKSSARNSSRKRCAKKSNSAECSIDSTDRSILALSQPEQQKQVQRTGNDAADREKTPDDLRNEAHTKDVSETGIWGTISTKEIYAAVLIALLVAIGVIVAIVVIISDESPNTDPPLNPLVGEKLAYLLAIIGNSTSNKASLDLLPSDPSYYGVNAFENTSESPQVRAMSWSLYGDDATTAQYWWAVRYALAAVYYSTKGDDSWTRKSSWLSSLPTCEWQGITCTRNEMMIEKLDLQSNSVQNEIPNELTLMTDIRTILLKDNNMTGTLSADLVALSNLRYLYLNENLLTGTVPKELASIGLGE